MFRRKDPDRVKAKAAYRKAIGKPFSKPADRRMDPTVAGGVTVTLEDAGTTKINAMAVIQRFRGADPSGAKRLVDQVPSEIGYFSPAVASDLCTRLRMVGATARATEREGPQLARIGQLVLYTDHLVTPEGAKHQLSRATTASIEASGGQEVVRGRNQGAKTASLLVPGGVRERAYDYRELYLTVEDPDWHYVIAIHPDLGLEARQFAADVRQAARGLGADHQPARGLGADHQAARGLPADHPAGETIETDQISKLERLAALCDRGVLTEDEFQEQKRKLFRSAEHSD